MYLARSSVGSVPQIEVLEPLGLHKIRENDFAVLPYNARKNSRKLPRTQSIA